MPSFLPRPALRTILTAATVGFGLTAAMIQPVHAETSSRSFSLEVTGFRQALATAAADDADISAFYRENGYHPIWTGADEASAARRLALIEALTGAQDHGLAPFDVSGLIADLGAVRSERDRARAEVALSKQFLTFARAVNSGQLVPAQIDPLIERKVNYLDRTDMLMGVAGDAPAAYIRSLYPSTPEYARLLREKLKLEQVIAEGGFGPSVPGGKLEPGSRAPSVIALRDRLIALGFLPASVTTAVYDARIESAVRQFQEQRGLEPDGVAGDGTIAELNVDATARLGSIVVAMERERWTNFEHGKRHVWVNLTDFTAAIVDDGAVTFRTRSVVGATSLDRRTPEFSDTMEHLIINPTWNVPRSIAVNEYLPQMQQNPNAAGYLQLIDGRGQVVSRSSVDFSQYTARNFPYDLKQPPSNSNALGLVKFMFPNPHNIYLHDTPAKSLFARETRAFSHGCIRLQQPFDFAYEILSKQVDNPVSYFQNILGTGRETQVNLDQHIPVHLVYRTAVTLPKGGMEYRRDIYGRDAKILTALKALGVRVGPALDS